MIRNHIESSESVGANSNFSSSLNWLNLIGGSGSGQDLVNHPTGTQVPTQLDCSIPIVANRTTLQRSEASSSLAANHGESITFPVLFAAADGPDVEQMRTNLQRDIAAARVGYPPMMFHAPAVMGAALRNHPELLRRYNEYMTARDHTDAPAPPAQPHLSAGQEIIASGRPPAESPLYQRFVAELSNSLGRQMNWSQLQDQLIAAAATGNQARRASIEADIVATMQRTVDTMCQRYGLPRIRVELSNNVPPAADGSYTPGNGRINVSRAGLLHMESPSRFLAHELSHAIPQDMLVIWRLADQLSIGQTANGQQMDRLLDLVADNVHNSANRDFVAAVLETRAGRRLPDAARVRANRMIEHAAFDETRSFIAELASNQQTRAQWFPQGVPREIQDLIDLHNRIARGQAPPINWDAHAAREALRTALPQRHAALDEALHQHYLRLPIEVEARNAEHLVGFRSGVRTTPDYSRLNPAQLDREATDIVTGFNRRTVRSGLMSDAALAAYSGLVRSGAADIFSTTGDTEAQRVSARRTAIEGLVRNFISRPGVGIGIAAANVVIETSPTVTGDGACLIRHQPTGGGPVTEGVLVGRQGNNVQIRMANGETVLRPLAEVTMVIQLPQAQILHATGATGEGATPHTRAAGSHVLSTAYRFLAQADMILNNRTAANTSAEQIGNIAEGAALRLQLELNAGRLTPAHNLPAVEVAHVNVARVTGTPNPRGTIHAVVENGVIRYELVDGSTRRALTDEERQRLEQERQEHFERVYAESLRQLERRAADERLSEAERAEARLALDAVRQDLQLYRTNPNRRAEVHSMVPRELATPNNSSWRDRLGRGSGIVSSAVVILILAESARGLFSQQSGSGGGGIPVTPVR